ncbi:MAG: class I SAM-dependent methyltransferase [Bacteroidetes bacterium]|nr:class I SAM-dependent methyltransferase [Bacteroidota bacterium]
MKCRFCNNELKNVFVDLGHSPLSNSFLRKEELECPEKYYPLKVFVCSKCYLVQTGEEKKPEEIFNEDYIYYSSFSKSWLKHAEEYVKMMMKRFEYNQNSLVIEIASNDGYLLQYFQKEKIHVLGIEPSKGTAEAAIKKGIETRIEYFGEETAKNLAEKNIRADLLIGNNVLAHVPDINDFVSGLKTVLKENGIITVEFPHLLQLVLQKQFDTIYHEHFFYFSFSTVKKIFEKHELDIFDVEQIPSHGGSLRIFAKHAGNKKLKISGNVSKLIDMENDYKMNSPEFYQSFQKVVDEIKINLIEFLLKQKRSNKKVAGYGAAAKGNTLLNFCGIKNDFISYLVDASIYKQGKYLPGSHIPVYTEEVLKQDKPDYIIIFPWNIKEEVMAQLSYVKKWNGKFIILIPQLEIL